MPFGDGGNFEYQDGLDPQTRADLKAIKANAAARKAASSSCMMAKTTITALTLLTIVARHLSGGFKPEESMCGGDWKVEGGAPKETPGCNG